MDIKKGLLVLFIILSAAAVLYSAGRSETKKAQESSKTPASGTIKNGLRVIPIETNSKEFNITVYRGDYIVLEPVDGKSHRLNIPSLDINTVIPIPENEKPYIKMKETGVVEFSINETKGSIKVVDFSGPRYWEVNSKEGADLIKNITPFILDVRTEGEYAEGHIKDSYLLPVQVLSEKISLIEKYKDQDILIYCRSGNRSTVASKILLDAGFTNVYNLRYGIKGWVADGYPVELN